MVLSLSEILGYIILPAFTLVLLPVARIYFLNTEKRIKELEDRMSHTLNEDEVKLIIRDKYDQLVEDTREIKAKLDKLYDLYIEQLKKGK